MATEKNNINKPTRKRKKAAQGTAQQQADAPILSPIGAELAQNADDVVTADGAKANREWDPHMGARDDSPKRDNVPVQTSDNASTDVTNQQSLPGANVANVPQRADGTYNDEPSDRSGAADAVSVPEQGAEKGDGKISENLGTISQGGVEAEDKKSAVSRVSVPSNDAKLRQRYDDIQRENAALQQKKVDIAGISSIVKADSASAEQLTGAVDAIDAQVADNDNGIAEMFADDAQKKSQQKKEADAFAKQKEQAEAIQAVKDIDWNDDAQVEGLDKDTVRVAMADAFPDSRVDLFNRPHVPAEDMRKAGYDVPDGSSASVYSMGFDIDGKEVLVTPIVDNGDGTYTVMSKDEVARYVGSLNPADPESDNLGLVISWDSKPDDGYRLHKMQEAFYATPQLVSSNGERVNEEPEEEVPQDSEKKGTSEKKGGNADAENGMSFWLKPNSGSVPNGTDGVPNDTTTSEADADNEKPKAAVEPDEPYLDLKSADEYGISEDNGEDVEEDVEGGTIRYKDYSKADKEAYDRLNEEERKNYDEIKSKIAEYDTAIKAARDDNNLPEVLEYNRLKAEYEAELAEYKDPDKLKKRRARRTIAMFADVLSAIANMWGAYRGAKPIELKSATGAISDAEAAEAKTLKERLKEYQKLADTARKEVGKEIARLDKADAATLAAYSKRLTRDYDKWRAAQEKEIENAKKKRDTSNQKKRDAQWREIHAQNNLERSKDRIDYSNAKSVESHSAKAATTDKYRQKAEGRAEARHERQADKAQKRKKEYYDYTHSDEE
jgi:hypothetical protein